MDKFALLLSLLAVMALMLLVTVFASGPDRCGTHVNAKFPTRNLYGVLLTDRWILTAACDAIRAGDPVIIGGVRAGLVSYSQRSDYLCLVRLVSPVVGLAPACLPPTGALPPRLRVYGEDAQGVQTYWPVGVTNNCTQPSPMFCVAPAPTGSFTGSGVYDCDSSTVYGIISKVDGSSTFCVLVYNQLPWIKDTIRSQQ